MSRTFLLLLPTIHLPAEIYRLRACRRSGSLQLQLAELKTLTWRKEAWSDGRRCSTALAYSMRLTGLELNQRWE